MRLACDTTMRESADGRVAERATETMSERFRTRRAPRGCRRIAGRLLVMPAASDALVSELRRNRDLLTASLMGFTAGYVTSNTKVRFNTFGGMMTGVRRSRLEWLAPNFMLTQE